MAFKLKRLDRRRKRIFHKERKSNKFRRLNKKFKNEVKLAKQDFYKKNIAVLKTKKPGQWYSCLKQITSYDQHRYQQPNVDEIRHKTDQEQAELIADQFAKIPNEYDSLNTKDSKAPRFDLKDVPKFQASKVWLALSELDTNKATIPGDFPAKLIKHFAEYLSEPLTDILNTSVSRGEYPQI